MIIIIIIVKFLRFGLITLQITRYEHERILAIIDVKFILLYNSNSKQTCVAIVF
jgi:hypothetical protein